MARLTDADLRVLVDRAIYAGEPIILDREQYGRLRGYIQECAGRYIDRDDAIRAQIALHEVRRLDKLHAYFSE